MSTVAICNARKGIGPAVRAALDGVNWQEGVEPGRPTMFKVNLTHDLLLPGSIVSPAVVRAAYEHMARFLGSVVLVETSQVVTDADKAFRRSGFASMSAAAGLGWQNMTHYGWVPRTIEGESLLVPEISTTHQVVNLCVMKTHFRSTISGALKNFWGFLPTGRERYHPDLSRKIAQVHALIPCRLHVMDAVVAMEGNGPKSGRPKEVGLVLASQDPVALDTVASRLMGFAPAAVHHIQECARRGLGVSDPARITLVGDATESPGYAFDPARENLVARIEGQVRRLRGQGRQLQGVPLEFLAWGARLWYQFAYEAFGTRRRVDRFLATTPLDGEWRPPRDPS